MRLRDTFTSAVRGIVEFTEWVLSFRDRTEYHSNLLHQTIATIQQEFHRLTLENKLAFYELLVGGDFREFYSDRSVFDKLKIDELYQNWLKVLQSPVISQNKNELEMFRHSLERVIFELNPKNEKTLRHLYLLLDRTTILLPSNASALKKAARLLNKATDKFLSNFIPTFLHYSVEQKRLILRYLAGNKAIQPEGSLPADLEKVRATLNDKTEIKKQIFIDHLCENLPKSRYHTQLRNKLLESFGLARAPLLTFKFGKNLFGSLQADSPCALAISPDSEAFRRPSLRTGV